MCISKEKVSLLLHSGVSNSRTKYIMKCFHDMVGQIQQKCIYAHEISANTLAADWMDFLSID